MVAFCTPLAGFLNSIIYVFSDDDVLKDWKSVLLSILFISNNDNENIANSDDSFSGPSSVYSVNRGSVQQYSINQKESFSVRNSSFYSINFSHLVSNNNSKNNSNSNSKSNSKNTSVDKTTNLFYKESLKKYIVQDNEAILTYSTTNNHHHTSDPHLLIKHLHDKLGSPTSTVVKQHIQNNSNIDNSYNNNSADNTNDFQQQNDVHINEVNYKNKDNIYITTNSNKGKFNDNNNNNNNNNFYNNTIVVKLNQEETFSTENSIQNPILKNNL
jgi:hypothetical protein